MDPPAPNGSHATNGHHTMSALEIEDDEEEQESLLQEATTDHWGLSDRPRTSQVVLRKSRLAASSAMASAAPLVGRIRGLLREGIGHHATCRNFALLASLALSMMFLVHVLDVDLEHASPDHVQNKQPPHQSTFGQASDYPLPKANTGHAVQSISTDNMRNRHGHYRHHPYQSPFASNAYEKINTTARQYRFDETRTAVMKQYGWWTKPDAGKLVRPNFETVAYRDLPSSQFPPKAWQLSSDYLRLFLAQATRLVNAVKIGIFDEYGYKETPDIDAIDKWRQERARLFGIQRLTHVEVHNGAAVDQHGDALPGVAYVNEAGWEGLVRKLLHAIMTEDVFYVVGVDGGGYSYLGQNWGHIQMMQFNDIMEPVLDKLGVRLITRNMGMEGASSTISALGGADVYGEADILWYLSDTTRPKGVESVEESSGAMDLLHRQAILSGERMPLILSPTSHTLLVESNDKAWIGNIQPGSPCKVTGMGQDGQVYGIHLPDCKACEYVECDDWMLKSGRCYPPKSACWVRRSDWNPEEPRLAQRTHAKFDGEGYPNFRQHQWEGRKLALLVLEALQEAVSFWSKQADQGKLPVDDNLWHIGSVYEALRESIRDLKRKVGQTTEPPPCETMLANVDPMMCHMSLHVYTEWTPRVDPWKNDLSSRVVSDYADSTQHLVPLYTGVDVLPLEWQDENAVDVHMIAIATNETIEEDSLVDDAVYNMDDYYGSDDDFPIRELREKDKSVAEPKLTDGLVQIAPRSSPHSRRLAFDDSEIDRKRWTLFNRPLGFCDGSAQSTCNRLVGNDCLLAGHNHYKAGFLGHGDSDWLYMEVQVTEGIILLRFDWEIDLGQNMADGQLRLDSLPEDFTFHYSINSEIQSLNKDAFLKFGVAIVDDLVVYPILMDTEMSETPDEKADIQVGIKISTGDGFSCKVLLTHVYYA